MNDLDRAISLAWLPMGRRIELEIAVRRARAQIWMRSGSREPIYALPGRLDDVYGRFIATDARPTLERLGEVLVPSGRMSELFAASGGDAESRKLLEDELINGGGHMPAFSTEFAPRVIDWLLAHPKP